MSCNHKYLGKPFMLKAVNPMALIRSKDRQMTEITVYCKILEFRTAQN